MPTTLSRPSEQTEAAEPALFTVVQETTWYSDEALMIEPAEYRTVEQRRAVRDVAALDQDPEFTAILKMKADTLVLTPAEAAVYNGQGQRRARRVGKPLPLE
jgi:hypothetical protein